MNYNYGITGKFLNVITSLIGRELKSYITNNEEKWHDSYEAFTLRLGDEDVEFTTKEIVHVADWFDELNTVEAICRPASDKWREMRVWVQERQPNGRVRQVKRPRFYEIPVGRVIDAITVAISAMSRDASKSKFGGESGSVDYIRAVVFHFDDDALVFDKGEMFWSDMWDIRSCKESEIAFHVEDAPSECPEYTSSVRLERFGNAK